MGKICLAMVVANERPVIERCLTSVEKLIDQICISVNGNDDNTLEFIKQWGEDKNIQTTVWEDPWCGYGPNKTRNLQKIHSTLDTEYILFLDADEVFITNPSDPFSYPTKDDAQKLIIELDSQPETDVFRMTTLYGSMVYPRWQIIRNNQVWQWHLPYQECLEGESSNISSYIKWLFNYSRHEGHSSRYPDLVNNVALLEEWLLNNPANKYTPRALFYLGLGYKDLRNNSKAKEFFVKRVEYKGGYNEERYMAAMYLAAIFTDPQQRKECLIVATHINPKRLEAYYELMNDCSKQRDFRQALAWGIMAPKQREILPDWMTVIKSVYDYDFDFELSVVAYYSALKGSNDDYEDTGIYRIGLDAINRCFNKLPQTKKQLAEKNKKYYIDKLIIERPQSLDHVENTSLIVVDDFYDDPYRIRNIALKMSFDVKGTYPGARTAPYIEEGTKERLEKIVGAKITHWPTVYNGSFQYTIANHQSWIHRDLTEWSMVVFLTPNAPVDGGTKMYIHKATGLTRSNTTETEELLRKDGRNESAWYNIDKIGNKFNRAILFKGRQSHMSDRYFGTDIESGRLFQTFFFNTVNNEHDEQLACKNTQQPQQTIEQIKWVPHIDPDQFDKHKYYIYIYVDTTNDWQSRLDYIYAQIVISGLLDYIDNICIVAVGEKCALVDGHIDNDKVVLVYKNISNTNGEQQCFRLIREHALREDCRFLYIGCLDSVYDHDLVDLLLYFNINKFDICISELNNYNIIGINIATGNDADVFCFKGNCWWTTSTYIKTLPSKIPSASDHWICSGNWSKILSLWQSNVDHSTWNYPEKMYVGCMQRNVLTRQF